MRETTFHIWGPFVCRLGITTHNTLEIDISLYHIHHSSFAFRFSQSLGLGEEGMEFERGKGREGGTDRLQQFGIRILLGLRLPLLRIAWGKVLSSTVGDLAGEYQPPTCTDTVPLAPLVCI